MTGISVTKLVKSWGETIAVDSVSFDVPQGSLTVLLGPSGCGKSTILRMIAGLEEVSDGQVFINGDDVTYQDASRRGISMVFQSYALFPHLSVRENILFGLKVRRVPREEQQKRLDEAAHMVGLQDLLDRKPANLSGGQRQRVALCRTIVSNRPVCLMDEPLSNLDAKLRAEMREEILALQRKLALTMVYVTHDQTEAMSMADQIVLLRAGQIEQIGSPAALYETPNSTFSASFLGLPPMNILSLEKIAAIKAAKEFIPTGNAGWMLGVRPEDISIADEGIDVEVLAADYMGAETVLRLRIGQQELLARINGRVAVSTGEALKINWGKNHIHLFDENGNRMEAKEAVS